MGTCYSPRRLMMTLLAGIVMQALSILAQDQPSVPHGCTEGSCYPATGNLLIGRAKDMHATSTCGLQGPEEYCIVSHLQESKNCFQCDSREPYDYWNRNSHRVENVIYLKDQDQKSTWWQSANGERTYYIQLDLEAEFHFTHLIMKFKVPTFRPAAMLIERSADFGRSWKPYRYFSYNCSKMFPSVPVRALHLIDDVVCEERYSDIEPSTEGEVIYKVLDPAIDVKDPYSLEIQELLRITNLRIHFTKLHTLGDNLLDGRREVLQKYYYSIYELVVRGSCFCYGHASECTPIPGISARVEGMIHGRCVCKHNTEGLNCEKCRPFYNNQPWRPAEADNPHSCRECMCNGHSNRCHFDMAVYLATGNASGGVCDDCLHNTMGRSCEMCKPFYYQDPTRDIRDPSVCVACDCDPVGSLEGGVCDSHTDLDLGMIAGQCRCKVNVKGTRCDYCKEGFYGLSRNDPVGCQPCNCDPRGIIMGGSPCDQVSGDCSCKRYVTGRYCNQCLAEYWGLSTDIAGCRACGCDFGGAYNNRCVMENGQCDCRPHIMGRQCGDVQPGYFCAALDYYTYEAEDTVPHSPDDPLLPGRPKPKAEIDCLEYVNTEAKRLRRHRRIPRVQQQRAALRKIRQIQQTPDVEVVRRERVPEQMVTWTGPGFARVRDGAGLVFTIDNIPFSMDYDVMIRYEPESTEDWEAIVSISSQQLPRSQRCGNVLPSEQMYTVTLRHQQRYIKMPRPFCFEPNNRYVVAIRFQRFRVTERHLTAFILIDSLVLFPRYTELPGFHGNDPASVHHREEMERYMCLDSFLMAPMPMLAEMCAKLLCSISAILHDGAVPCECDLQGSLSAVCEKIGGQCQCKPSVIGRRCNQCAPGTYGFGPYGCHRCDCHPQGAVSSLCDPVSGQCWCQHGATGRQCSNCQPGHWGFPSCRPCQCNGHSETCDPQTGACTSCRDYTSGHHCDRCLDGFYGNPILGSGEHCRPCPCPGNPGSGHSNGDSCSTAPASNQIICHCRQGYTGPRCDRCSPGYFGSPERPGGECRPCQCNNNIDSRDPESCDPRSGQCLKCLYNTDGPACATYFTMVHFSKRSNTENQLFQSVLKVTARWLFLAGCTCNIAGTLQSQCSGDVCNCDRTTGTCPCRANVIGQNCDQCAPEQWNFGRDGGCEPCSCYLQHSLRTDCNMFTGQCFCKPGFGGRVCSDCQENYWGDPNSECTACNCDPSGSLTLQCDRKTGHCSCVEGVTGSRCDQCARGFTGNFPRCAPCHPCFEEWDELVCTLRRELDKIQEKVKQIQESGVTSDDSVERIQKLEEKLAQIQSLINDRSREMLYHSVHQTAERLRKEVVQTDRRLQVLSGELNSTMHGEKQQREHLGQLETELRELNDTVTKRRRELENLISAGTSEKFENVRKYYQESLDAERRANASVSGSDSPVEQSQETRNLTESLMNKKKDEFFRTMTAQKKSLKELQAKTKDLDKSINNLSAKVCGSKKNGNGCVDDPCGGANCRDDFGNRKCGGGSCNGTLSASVRALNLVESKTKEIEAAAQDLDNIQKKLQDVAKLTQDIKAQAEGTLTKAQRTKDEIVSSNQKLREFIQKIRDFLTVDGADPKDIELVARQVLSISLPVSASNLTKTIQEIKECMVNLSDVNAGVRWAEPQKGELSAHEEGEEVWRPPTPAAVSLRRSWGEVRRPAPTAAVSLPEIVGEVRRPAPAAALALPEVLWSEPHQGELPATKKGGEVRRPASPAAILVQAWTSRLSAVPLPAGDLEEVELKYKELEGKVGGLGDGASSIGSVTERASNIKKEAEELLKKANKDMKQLDELEKRFGRNEKRMEAQAKELIDLEKNITSIRNIIRSNVTQYSTCS
ncbi:laminin subunit beta-1 [Huso huso]|uniref:Laminin subunit beta-1 n=1 Tax=Huso huso TaxID=61971 RepID=A0ABR0Z6X3_HUSHU